MDPKSKEIDEHVFIDLDSIIHLAGANIGEKRWTKNRKLELYESRIGASNFLFEKVNALNVNLKSFISASAIGWYGNEISEQIYTESDYSSSDFLGQLCKGWELAADKFKNFNIEVSKVRTGVVLTENGGALSKMCMPINLGLGAVLGSGKQYMPWIHIADLCEIYAQLVETKITGGTYNAVAPSYVTNEEFTKLIARAVDKNLWLPHIPSWFLNVIIGDMASMLLGGSRVSSEKIIKNGFKFKYAHLNRAIASILD